MRSAVTEDRQSPDGTPAEDRAPDEPQQPSAEGGNGQPADHEPKVRLMVPAKKSAEGKVLVPAHPLEVASESAPGAAVESRQRSARLHTSHQDPAPAPAPVSDDVAASRPSLAPASAPEDFDDPALYPQSTKGATWIDRVEAFLSRLSTRDNFWHRVFSLLFLPLAFWSGIRMRRTGEGAIGDEGSSFSAILPFTKFNKNWYNAMAGASLLANTEIAGGMYVFGEAGGDYTVVCKNLNYTFLRPCYGPAVYRAEPRENLKSLIAAGGEFNITLDMDIRQLGMKAGEREKRVGRAEITFHVTPKGHAKVRQKKLKQRDRQRTQMQRSRG